MSEFDDYEEEYEDGRPHPTRIIYKVIKIVAVIVCVSVTAGLFLRICSQNNAPREIDTIMVNKALSDAYAEQGEELEIFFQNYDIYSAEEGERGAGYFAVTEAIFIPAAEQAQLILRYNNSTLKYLPEDFKGICTEIPERSEDVFDVTLVKVIDLTPNDVNDNDNEKALKKERYFASDVIKAEKGLHNYRRFTFDGIDTTDALEIYVCIYYKGALDYAEDPFGSVSIYEKSENNRVYSLSKNDRNALNSAKNGD